MQGIPNGASWLVTGPNALSKEAYIIRLVASKFWRCVQKEADSPIVGGERILGSAGEVIMLCMEPLCSRMMQLASFTLSFT
jgi:hypothetical protein